MSNLDADAPGLYLDLLEATLTRSIFGDSYQLTGPRRGSVRWLLFRLVRSLLPPGFEIVRRVPHEARDRGDIWPVDAETMVGPRRLRQIRDCSLRLIEDDVPGDLLEAGVWRGGATIYMRAILRAYGVTDRRVWVVDSFEGLPPPRSKDYPADTTDWSGFSQLAVSVDEVKSNFTRYGLLDDQVRFLEGFFSETLPAAPIARLALLRIDADMYQSTLDVLTHLYSKLSAGGFVIVDEYGTVPQCRMAVDDFRAQHAVSEKIEYVDHACIQWRKRLA